MVHEGKLPQPNVDRAPRQFRLRQSQPLSHPPKRTIALLPPTPKSRAKNTRNPRANPARTRRQLHRAIATWTRCRIPHHFPRRLHHPRRHLRPVRILAPDRPRRPRQMRPQDLRLHQNETLPSHRQMPPRPLAARRHPLDKSPLAPFGPLAVQNSTRHSSALQASFPALESRCLSAYHFR